LASCKRGQLVQFSGNLAVVVERTRALHGTEHAHPRSLFLTTTFFLPLITIDGHCKKIFFVFVLTLGLQLALRTRWLQLFIRPYFFSYRSRVQTQKEAHQARTLPNGCSCSLQITLFYFTPVWSSPSICTFSHGGLLGSGTAPNPCCNYALVAPEKWAEMNKNADFFKITQQFFSPDIFVFSRKNWTLVSGMLRQSLKIIACVSEMASSNFWRRRALNVSSCVFSTFQVVYGDSFCTQNETAGVL